MTTQTNPPRPQHNPSDPSKPYDPNNPKRDEREDKDKDKDKDKDDDDGKDAPGRSTQTSGPGSVTGSGTNNVASVKDPRGSSPGDGVLIHPPPLPAIPHEEHVKQLVAMAEANEQYNNEVNRAQTEQTEAEQKLITENEFVPVKDPAKEQQRVMDEYKLANDPKEKEKRLKGEMEARKKRDEAEVKAQLAGQR